MNDVKTKKYRIGIDARFYGPLGKGLGRYTQEVVDNVTALDTQNEYVVFLRKENFDDFECDGVRVKKVLADISWYGLAEQLIFPRLIARQKLDLMHFPHFNVPIFCPVRFVLTIHDLILINFPTVRATTLGPLIYKIKNLGYRAVINIAVKRAKKIIAVSEFTKNDLIKHFRIKADKIVVTYEGVARLDKGIEGEINPADDQKILSAKFITKPYLLYIGNAYPHKNLEGLIRIFKKLLDREAEVQLVLVGKEDYFYERLKKLAGDLGLWRTNSPTPVIFAGFAPDAELRVFFRNGLGYVFPSFYEGFGLPPLEAMANGLPVVSSDKTSLPEILGNAALYFNPDEEEDVLKKLESIVSNEHLRGQLRVAGYEQAKKYSWNNCARQTLSIYDNILK
jgi:hypothetical protein